MVPPTSYKSPDGQRDILAIGHPWGTSMNLADPSESKNFLEELRFNIATNTSLRYYLITPDSLIDVIFELHRTRTQLEPYIWTSVFLLVAWMDRQESLSQSSL